MKQALQSKADDAQGSAPLEAKVNETIPIIASARAGLASKDDAVVRRMPVDYTGRTVREAIDYLVSTDLDENERPYATSISRELNSASSIVVINGQTAKLSDPIEKYLVTKSHELPSGTKQYRELEIELSSVQQGGYRLR